MCCAGYLILNTSCEFHYDDVTVKSVINIVIESIAQGTLTHDA